MPRGARRRHDALATYATKRDFAATPEPDGRKRRATAREDDAGHGLFVVQKHAASHLHYDFRLEHDGVLLSWAVPKEPSLDPRVRRLAVQVEDHPVAYADFAGVIPPGNYGAGNVEIWDRGRWAPQGDVDQGLRRGRLDFRLIGGKLAGAWHLVRMKDAKPATSRSKPNWLLFRGSAETPPKSGTRRPTGRGRKPESAPASQPTSEAPAEASSAAAELFQLATLVEEAPAGDRWVHETKWDGYRLLAAREGASVRLWSRSGADWTARLPEVAAAIARLPARSAVLDGELVSLAGGKSGFQNLQAALGEEPGSRERKRLRYVVFDLLQIEGTDLRPLPLLERKARLRKLLGALPARSILRASPIRRGRGPERLAAACAAGLEGIVSKNADASYRSGRGGDWLKIKCRNRQELIIVGFTLSRSAARRELGALLLAVAGENGKFVYAGRVGTGFDRRSRADLLARLEPLVTERSPVQSPTSGGRIPGSGAVHWVRPVLVAEVQFTEWTADGSLRHPSFVGLREDKKAKNVRRERPAELRRSPGSGAGSAAKVPPAKTKRSGHAAPGEVVEGVAITHPERLLFADSEVTKADLARYFAAVWPRLEPHLRDRPLALVRCPEGARAACFFQKHWPHELPGVTAVDVSAAGKQEPPQSKVETAAGLLGLSQHGVIELHLWGARDRDIERPDRVVFDLDPGPGVAWRDVVAGARLLRSLLAELGLESFPLLSGGKGVHVVVPIVPDRDWPTVKSFAAAIAGALSIAAPDRYVAKATKGIRGGKIFIDYLRNGRGATAIAPYSPRARARGPVATPIAWEELARSAPDRWTIPTVLRRLRTLARDPWPGYFRLVQSISQDALSRVGVVAAASRPPAKNAKKSKRK